MKNIMLVTIVFFSCLQFSNAQPGQSDSSFGTNGFVTASLEYYSSTAVQQDGKIVAVGVKTNQSGNTTVARVARYNIDGSFDTSFTGDGKLLPDFGTGIRVRFARSVAIQSDGKIVVGVGLAMGKIFPFGLIRYNTNGSVDSSFGKDGRQITDFGNENIIKSIAIQSDGKIVVAGFTIIYNPPQRNNYNLIIARYSKDGFLDETFSGTGKVIVDIGFDDRLNSVAIQSDDKIVVAGTINNDFAVLRYNNDGSPDKTFSGDGKLTTHFGLLAEANAVVIQGNGKIVAAGTYDNGSYGDIALSRYNTDGSLDKTFSTDGKQTVHFGENANGYSYAYSAAIDSNEKIVAAGYGLVRLKKDGTLDSTFNYDGKITTGFIASIAIANRKLYTVGTIVNPPKGFMASYLLGGKNGPAITLTTDTSTYVMGGTVKLIAKAWDAGDTITKIEFYNGSELIKTVTDTPYVYEWTNVPKGNYSLTAKATDKGGQFTISAAVRISVVSNQPPVVNIITPARDTNFIVSQSIRLTAEASEPGGTIRSVDFYDGNTLIFSDVTEPYTGVWDSVPTGSYHVTAVATDNEGLQSTSASVHITVLHNRPPMVNITSPVNGATYVATATGATIVLSADAIPHGGKIQSVKFYNGITLIHAEENFPYLWSWKNVPAGTYIITAEATDTYGRVVLSVPVTITVTANGVSMVSRRPSSAGTNTTLDNKKIFMFSPNPVHTFLDLSVRGFEHENIINISVISPTGVVVKTLQTSGSSQKIQMDVSSLASGVYTVKINGSKRSIYRQIIKL